MNFFLLTDHDKGSSIPDGAIGGVEENELPQRKTATDIELEKARVLSAETRRILSDLNAGKLQSIF